MRKYSIYPMTGGNSIRDMDEFIVDRFIEAVRKKETYDTVVTLETKGGTRRQYMLFYKEE